MALISRYLDADVASGRVRKVLALTQYMGSSYVDVVCDDGTYWVYFDASYVSRIGEIARQRFIPTWDILDPWVI